MINGFNYGIVREGRIAVVIMEALVTRIPYTLLRIHYSLLHTRLYLPIYTVFVFNSHRSQSSWNPLKAFLRAITSPRSVKRKQKKKKKKKMRKKKRKKNTARVLLHFITEQSIVVQRYQRFFLFTTTPFTLLVHRIFVA